MNKRILFSICSIFLLTACTEESTEDSTKEITEEIAGEKESAKAAEEESSLKLEKVQIDPEYGWEQYPFSATKTQDSILNFISHGAPEDQLEFMIRTDGKAHYVLFDEKSPSYIEKVLNYVVEGTDIGVKQLMMEMTSPDLFIRDYGLAKDNIADFEPAPAGDFGENARVINISEDSIHAGIDLDFIVDGDNVILYYLAMPNTYISDRSERAIITEDIAIEVDLLDLVGDNGQVHLYNEDAVAAIHVLRKAIQEERMNVVTNTIDRYLEEFTDSYRYVNDTDEMMSLPIEQNLFGEELLTEQLNYMKSLYAQGKGDVLEGFNFTVQSFKALPDTTTFEVTTSEEFTIRPVTERSEDATPFNRQVTYQLQYTYDLGDAGNGYARPYVITGMKIH